MGGPKKINKMKKKKKVSPTYLTSEETRHSLKGRVTKKRGDLVPRSDSVPQRSALRRTERLHIRFFMDFFFFLPLNEGSEGAGPHDGEGRGKREGTLFTNVHVKRREKLRERVK